MTAHNKDSSPCPFILAPPLPRLLFSPCISSPPPIGLLSSLLGSYLVLSRLLHPQPPPQMLCCAASRADKSIVEPPPTPLLYTPIHPHPPGNTNYKTQPPPPPSACCGGVCVCVWGGGGGLPEILPITVAKANGNKQQALVQDYSEIWMKTVRNSDKPMKFFLVTLHAFDRCLIIYVFSIL